jgi:glutaconate CoA-transferase subunit A
LVNTNNKNGKLMTAEEAISKFVNDGDCIALGGFVTNRRAYTLVRELIKQGKKELYLESGAAGGDADMIIGAGLVKAIMISYAANSGYTQVCRRFRKAIENKEIMFEDYSLDVQTIIYHGAALGLTYVPVKNMLGSDLVDKWGISEEVRKADPKLPDKKMVVMEDPFNPGSQLCCVPTPQIDVALIHVQKASPDGTCIIEGPTFQDLDIAMAAKYCIITCEELVDDEVMRQNPERASLPGLVIDAVVHAPFGAHPSQCFNYYDYDGLFYRDYDKISKSDEAFNQFLNDYVYECKDHSEYLDKISASKLLGLKIPPGKCYLHGMIRK